jgi:hypothetical protein
VQTLKSWSGLALIQINIGVIPPTMGKIVVLKKFINMKKIKQIIRIEHPDDGLGIFNSFDKDVRIKSHSRFTTIFKRHTNPAKYPSYHYDEELRDQITTCDEKIKNYRFGFHSLEVLNKAFTKAELKEIINQLGFRVYMIEVSEWIESKFQVIFKPGDTLEKKDISFMFV